ncbi:MAG: TRAP transporter small permease [Geminicoccaceae bacterium]
MGEARETVRRVLSVVGRIEQVVVVLLVCLIVTTISAQVVSRYLFDRPIVWVEEVAVYAFIWSVFIGASLALKHDRHLRIETYVGRLPPRAQALARALVALLMLALFLTLIPPLLAAIGIEMRRMTIALPIPVPIGWFFSVPLFVGVLSMTATTLYRLWGELSVVAGAPAAAPIMPPISMMEEDEEAASERALLGERP